MNKSTPAKSFNFFHALNVVGPFFGLLLVLGLFSLSSEVRPYLFTGGNFKLILIQTVIVALGALGMTMIIVSGGIDLSVGSVVAFTSVLGATLLVRGCPTAETVMLTVLAGGLIGLVNGVVIAGFGMMPFIVTLGMMGVVRGLAKWLAGNQTVNNPPGAPLNHLMARVSPTDLFPWPPGVWIAIGLAILVSVVMRQTVFGRYICDWLQRSDRAPPRHSRAAAKGAYLRAGRTVLWTGGFDASFAPDAGRSDGGHRLGTGYHCGGGHWRREFERRDGEHPWFDDRRVDHGGSAQRLQPDGLAEFHAGNYHRPGYHHGGGIGHATPAANEKIVGMKPT